MSGAFDFVIRPLVGASNSKTVIFLSAEECGQRPPLFGVNKRRSHQKCRVAKLSWSHFLSVQKKKNPGDCSSGAEPSTERGGFNDCKSLKHRHRRCVEVKSGNAAVSIQLLFLPNQKESIQLFINIPEYRIFSLLFRACLLKLRLGWTVDTWSQGEPAPGWRCRSLTLERHQCPL